jgi:hypothetical protein
MKYENEEWIHMAIRPPPPPANIDLLGGKQRKFCVCKQTGIRRDQKPNVA